MSSTRPARHGRLLLPFPGGCPRGFGTVGHICTLRSRRRRFLRTCETTPQSRMQLSLSSCVRWWPPSRIRSLRRSEHLLRLRSVVWPVISPGRRLRLRSLANAPRCWRLNLLLFGSHMVCRAHFLANLLGRSFSLSRRPIRLRSSPTISSTAT
jgi:hypothetical protein